MAIVEKYVVRMLKTNGVYGAGDVIGLSRDEFEAYMADAPAGIGKPDSYRTLIHLLYVEAPNGDRMLADDKGKLTKTIAKREDVVRESDIRTVVHHMARAEKLKPAIEAEFCEKALADPKLTDVKNPLKAFQENPSAYFGTSPFSFEKLSPSVQKQIAAR